MALLFACVSTRGHEKNRGRRATFPEAKQWPPKLGHGPITPTKIADFDQRDEQPTEMSWGDAAANWWYGESESSTAKASPETPERQSYEEPTAAGARRDRTSHFARLRAARVGRKDHRSVQHQLACCGAVIGDSHDAAADTLHCLYEQATAAHTSLVSRLAQHSGIVRFGAEFSSRAPPLELRVALPEVEAAIEQQLLALDLLLARVSELQLPPESRHQEVREALATYTSELLERLRPEFDAQRQTLRDLATRSPLLAPTLSLQLSAKLAAAMRSPSTTASTATSPRSPRSQHLPSQAFSSPGTDSPPAFELSEVEEESDDDPGHIIEHATVKWPSPEFELRIVKGPSRVLNLAATSHGHMR